MPSPSPAREDVDHVEVPVSLAAKVLLLNELLRSGVSRAELARRMGCRPQEVNRIINLGHSTKIDTIAQALAALGKHLEVSAV